MGRLHLWLVGQFRIFLDTRELDLGYNKVRALLAYLVLEADRVHGRDELAALLWPASSQGAARKSLRQALSTLRSAIDVEGEFPSFLIANRETIQFNLEADFKCDASDFYRLIEQSKSHLHKDLKSCPQCLDALTEAVSLYKGDLLKNLSIPDSLPFEEWLLLGRERMRLQVIDALGHLVSGYERNADSEAAIHFSRRRLALDPWNEDAYRALMHVLNQRGQRTAALAEFERCQRVLADELGIEPSVETIALYESIRSNVRPLSESAPVEKIVSGSPLLPHPLTSLIGREKEASTLVDLIRRESVRLVTVLGPPGIGKTRLAIQVAPVLVKDYAENVFYVPLAAVTNPALVIQIVAQSLHVCQGDCNSPFDQLVQVLRDRKTLLILDNFEHVLAAAPVFSALLQACPDLKLLVTARAPLHLRGEQRFMLDPLSVPLTAPGSNLVSISESPAVKLFVERAQAVAPDFVLTSRNATSVAAICTFLDGLPLAIELAAVSIRLLTPQQLEEQLTGGAGSALNLLKGYMRDEDIQHQTLRQAFQWSYDLLDQGARLLFTRLAVFSPDWTLEAADAVCDIGDLQTGSVNNISALLDNCLIQKVIPAAIDRSEYRFTMLTTLREFALDRLAASGEIDLLRQRHADYFLTFAKLAEPEISGHNQIAWLERLESDLDNFRAALDWTIASSPDQALQLAVALFPFWHVRSLLSESRHFFEQVLAKAPARTPLRGRALAAAGLLAQRQGDLVEAEELISDSVKLCFELGDRPGLAYALNNLAIVVMSKGDNEKALQYANESLAICRDQDFPLGVARAQMIIGQIALNEDHLDKSRQALEESLRFWHQKGDLKNEILCQINLGRLFLLQGDFSKATIFLEECLDLSRKIKDEQWELVANWNLAEIRLKKGKPDEAGPIFAACLENSRKVGDRYFEAMSLNRLGQVSSMQGDPLKGMRYFRASLEIGQQTGSKWVAADGLLQLGRAAQQVEDTAAAESSLLESLDLFYEQGEQSDIVLNLELLALVFIQRSQPLKAVRLLAATAAWRTATGIPLADQFKLENENAIALLQVQLRAEEWNKAWAEGQLMNLDQAVAMLTAGG